jgi:2,4-dienoyl-CoA reductase-like NADH-dependent reductase (Old Yellow Enzyme family)
MKLRRLQSSVYGHGILKEKRESSHDETACAMNSCIMWKLMRSELWREHRDFEPSICANSRQSVPKSLPARWFAMRVANGFNRATVTQALAEDVADAVAFGRLFIANPDLPRRFRLNAPLNTTDESTFFGGAKKGYADYPALGPQFVQR